MAARGGAPQNRQVAERWHLLKNIGDALERMMYRHIPLIRLVASELSPKKSPEPEPSVPAPTFRRPELYRILKTKNKPQLSSWFTRVRESGSTELQRVAAGMYV